MNVFCNSEFKIFIITTSYIIILLFSILLFQTNFSYSSTNTAILNIHWGMNPNQVENAVNTELEEGPNSTDKIKVFNNRLRIVGRARLAEVKYYFYKNQLYKLEIKKEERNMLHERREKLKAEKLENQNSSENHEYRMRRLDLYETMSNKGNLDLDVAELINNSGD